MTEIYPIAQSIVESGTASEREVCEFLKFARSPFKRWKQLELTPLEKEDKAVLPLIVKSFYAHRRRCGSRRIRDDLREQGFRFGRRRVARLMEIAGISAIQPKSYKPRTTESKHTFGYNENLIMNLKNVKQPNRLWVGDITYIPIRAIKFGYLAVLMDRFSRRIVGWKLGTEMTQEIVIASLKAAIRNRKPEPKMIHHSDRGGQYAGKEYRKIIKRAGMKQSMSRAGDCYDNAFMEPCFGTIKNELEMTEYKNYNEALKDIRDYISYYNFERKHSAIEYQTPNQFEQYFSLK